MKKNKKIIIGLASIILLASLIFIIIVCVNKHNTSKLEDQLKTVAVNYYEEDYKFYYPDFLKTYKEFKITMDQLKRLQRDVSALEEKNCDEKETYVTFKYVEDDNSYTTDVHLSCEK